MHTFLFIVLFLLICVTVWAAYMWGRASMRAQIHHTVFVPWVDDMKQMPHHYAAYEYIFDRAYDRFIGLDVCRLPSGQGRRVA